MLYDEKLIDFAVGEKSEEKLAVQTYKYNKGVSVRKKRNCPECFEVGPTHQGKKQSKAKISRGFGSLSLCLSHLSSDQSLCNNSDSLVSRFGRLSFNPATAKTLPRVLHKTGCLTFWRKWRVMVVAGCGLFTYPHINATL